MIIGNFSYTAAQDTYAGEIGTLTGPARKVVFQPNQARGEKAPEYRVVGESKAGDLELGAAWKKRSDDGRDYLSVRLDDPALPQPVNCALVASAANPGKFILVWSRDNRKG